MAEFAAYSQSSKPSFSLLEVDHPNMAEINHLGGMINSSSSNSILLENSNLMNFQSFNNHVPFSSHDNFFGNPTAEFPGNLAENFPGNFSYTNQIYAYQPNSTDPTRNSTNEPHESKKRKAVNLDASESSSGNSSPQVSEITGVKKKNVIIYFHTNIIYIY